MPYRTFARLTWINSRFKKVNNKLPLLKEMMAELRIFSYKGGGCFDANTGSGEAWHPNSDMLESGWFCRRKIKAGKWDGPWIRIKSADIKPSMFYS